MPKKNTTQEISIFEIESLRIKAEDGRLDKSDSAMVINLCTFTLSLLQLIEDKTITITRLKKFIFGSKSEKSKIIHNQNNNSKTTEQPSNEFSDTNSTAESDQHDQLIPTTQTGNDLNSTSSIDKPKKKPGHGRLAAEDYPAAKVIYCPNPSLSVGDECPNEFCKGHLYDTKEPQVLIKREARPIIEAIKYERQVLRCSYCQQRFAANLPNGVSNNKYDITADVMIAILHYSGALPFYRLERIQQMMGVPLSASNQYERSEIVANALHPIYLELERQAAKLDILHTDDTSVKILSLMKENKTLPENERKGMHTTGINARSTNFDIALYYSGRRYSGENLAELLEKRPNDLTAPVLVADAEKKNWCFDYVAILSKCLVHARRQFVNCQPAFEEECGKVINDLGEVYKIEAKTKDMTPKERLLYHQEHSLPIMNSLKDWLNKLIEERKVQPNSSMGKAIKYFNNHWIGLTQFLKVENCPLDNNCVERMLRKAVILRKNSLFFKTENGANTGSVLVSVIETCYLNHINPFDYLVAIMSNKKGVRINPQMWLPWNYQLQKDKVA